MMSSSLMLNDHKRLLTFFLTVKKGCKRILKTKFKLNMYLN